MSNIQTSETRRRALRATVDGLGPEIAEILARAPGAGAAQRSGQR